MSTAALRYRLVNERSGLGIGSGIVTPEAVLLEFETAGVGSRTAGGLIDVGIRLAAIIVVGLAVSTLSGAAGGTEATIVAVVLFFLIIVGYPIAFESLWNGRTPGKAALGLRVVTIEGAPLRFRHAAIRSILGLFELWIFFGSAAVLAVICTRRDQRLGDLAAGTLVLRERSASRGAAVAMWFPAPNGHEAYVASLDVSALSVDQYGLIRSFLLRVGDLSPGARASLAANLGNRVAGALRHTPPAAIHPEVFLVCVAAAYQGLHGQP